MAMAAPKMFSLAVLVVSAGAVETCSTLGNRTAISEMLGMRPTPLPGNYFMLNNFDNRLGYDKHPYSELLRSSTDERPFLTRIDVLRTPGVTEALHYIAGDAVWSWQGGCPSTYLVIRRSGDIGNKTGVTDISWHTIGPDVESGAHTFNLVIRRGDLYAAFNSDECGTYIGVSIAPGLNMPPEIETPIVPDLKALFLDDALQQQFADSRDNGTMKSLATFLEEYGQPEARRMGSEAEHGMRREADSHRVLSSRQCNVLGNGSVIADSLGMVPTPLPGNFFSNEMIGPRWDYADHPYKELLRDAEKDKASIRPLVSHIQVLRTPGVTEPLHYIAGDAVWSFQAGCPVDYLVITRKALENGKYEVLDVAWKTIGMDIEGGKQEFSLMIKGGDLYAAFANTECGTFIKTTIAPGLHMPPEIETPEAYALKASFEASSLQMSFNDSRSGGTKTLAEFLETYGKPDADTTTTSSDGGGGVNVNSAHVTMDPWRCLLLATALAALLSL
eukprot:gb/GFBE01011542.1/.p1 GENE.gb/GFBE01011542.1/~~gb/GFBE01011542.1/.p1  ORF type:complete len:502 (+),score=110.65 gb/GFBE01011542.1/:1-1506(+)